MFVILEIIVRRMASIEETVVNERGKDIAKSPSSAGFNVWSSLASSGLWMASSSLQVGNFIPSLLTTTRSGWDSLTKFTSLFRSTLHIFNTPF